MIIGLVGFIGSGKGTVGEILSKFGFQPVSFASGVKDVTAEMFGWPRELLEGVSEESRNFRETPDEFWSKELGKSFTPRLALQLMGTEVGRQIFHEDFWIIKTKQIIQNKQKANNYFNYFVVTDVRFKNEMKFIQSQGGILIEVRRGNNPNWYEIAAQANLGNEKAEKIMHDLGIHESEWRWIGGEIDQVIENDGTKDELHYKVADCLTKFFGSSMMEEYL